MIVKSCIRGFLLVAVALVAIPAQAALTGEYLFENNALDTSGNGRNGTASGGSTFTAGLYEGSTAALLQTGANQTVELPSNADFIRNAPGATLMAWVRPDNLSTGESMNMVVVNNANSAGGGGVGDARALLEYTPGTGFRAIGRQASEGSTIIAGGAPVVGETYFVAGVFDYVNGDMFLYIDGEEVASNTNVTAWTANSEDTANLVARIGSHANGTQQFWVGAIDGVRIHNTALSAQDILDIYDAESFPPPLPGDTNGNGIVEPEDLTPIRTNWRMTGKTRMEGNLSGDPEGLVDFADFRQWKTAILAGGGSLEGLDLSFATVPEPATASLVLLSGLGFCRCRASHRRG